MRCLFIVAALVAPVAAQNPVVRLSNVSRPASTEFQVGDRFEVVISGRPGQPVSVRTSRLNRTDWGPAIGMTDRAGRWSTTGQFEGDDFGDWNEVWTVGVMPANPALHFWVGAPCLKNARGSAAISGIAVAISCETADGLRNFGTRSDTDAFRTLEGRTIAGFPPSNLTPEQSRAPILPSLITDDPPSGGTAGLFGVEAGSSILKLIGVNALSDDETMRLLRKLLDSTHRDDLKRQIAETIEFVQTQ